MFQNQQCSIVVTSVVSGDSYCVSCYWHSFRRLEMFGISVTSPLSISWAAVERDLGSTWGELRDFQSFPSPHPHCFPWILHDGRWISQSSVLSKSPSGVPGGEPQASSRLGRLRAWKNSSFLVINQSHRKGICSFASSFLWPIWLSCCPKVGSWWTFQRGGNTAVPGCFLLLLWI